MAEPRVGNLLGLAVLAYLTREPMHPYELGRNLRRNGDERSIKFNQGSLYMVMGQLARARLITPQEKSRQGQRPERTVYALTAEGRTELRDWLRDLVEQPVHEYPQFVAALSLMGALPPDEVAVLLQRRLERLEHLREEARRVVSAADDQGIPPLFVVEEDYRIRMLDAEIEFAQEFVDRITDPTSGWRDDWARYHAERTNPDQEQASS